MALCPQLCPPYELHVLYCREGVITSALDYNFSSYTLRAPYAREPCSASDHTEAIFHTDLRYFWALHSSAIYNQGHARARPKSIGSLHLEEIDSVVPEIDPSIPAAIPQERFGHPFGNLPNALDQPFWLDVW